MAGYKNKLRFSESGFLEQSIHNRVTFPSTSTLDFYKDCGKLKPVTLSDGEKVVRGIVDRIFDSFKIWENISSGTPSETICFADAEETDVRLARWQATLKDRAVIQDKIYRRTGRKPNEMLLNMPASLDRRERGNLNRLLDFADRMNPTFREGKTPSFIPMRCHPTTGMATEFVAETLPLAEKTGKVQVVITGLPKITKDEILYPPYAFNNESSKDHKRWKNSPQLAERIIEKKNDIRRVLKFYPDIDELGVVGSNTINVSHDGDIQMVGEIVLHSISDSSVHEHLHKTELTEPMPNDKTPPVPNIGLKINEKVYMMSQKLNCPAGEFQFHFQCEPFHYDLKEVLRLENIGKRVIFCYWQSQNRNKPNNTERLNFVFDSDLITLFPGQVYVTKTLFRPQRVCVCKQVWNLRIYPKMFPGRHPSLSIQLCGKCVPPQMYIEKIGKHMKEVADKSTEQTMKHLANYHGELATGIAPPDILCPYDRTLDERDIFNAQNMGYQCTRYTDIETLKNLYNELKLPRESAWDLRLDTIKKLILRMPEVEKRQEIFAQLMELQDSMKGRGHLSLCSNAHDQQRDLERHRSRLIYVRGCIGNGIEEWQYLMETIEHSSLKSELLRFHSRSENEGELSDNDDESKPWLRQLKVDHPQNYALRKLKANKFYRDSLFMHTYTLICDVVENIVSVIESTDCI